MAWLRRLLANREAAKLALEILDQLMEAAEDASEIRRRAGRKANAEDLQDSLQRFTALRRSPEDTAG